MKSTNDAFGELAEQHIDLFNLAATLGEIAEICYAKAEHLRSNWQDDDAANAWDKAASAIAQFANSRRIQDVTIK